MSMPTGGSWTRPRLLAVRRYAAQKLCGIGRLAGSEVYESLLCRSGGFGKFAGLEAADFGRAHVLAPSGVDLLDGERRYLLLQCVIPCQRAV